MDGMEPIRADQGEVGKQYKVAKGKTAGRLVTLMDNLRVRLEDGPAKGQTPGVPADYLLVPIGESTPAQAVDAVQTLVGRDLGEIEQKLNELSQADLDRLVQLDQRSALVTAVVRVQDARRARPQSQLCPICQRSVTVTGAGILLAHPGPEKKDCEASLKPMAEMVKLAAQRKLQSTAANTPIADGQTIECPVCKSGVRLKRHPTKTILLLEAHPETSGGGCPASDLSEANAEKLCSFLNKGVAVKEALRDARGASSRCRTCGNPDVTLFYPHGATEGLLSPHARPDGILCPTANVTPEDAAWPSAVCPVCKDQAPQTIHATSGALIFDYHPRTGVACRGAMLTLEQAQAQVAGSQAAEQPKATAARGEQAALPLAPAKGIAATEQLRTWLGDQYPNHPQNYPTIIAMLLESYSVMRSIIAKVGNPDDPEYPSRSDVLVMAVRWETHSASQNARGSLLSHISARYRKIEGREMSAEELDGSAKWPFHAQPSEPVQSASEQQPAQIPTERTESAQSAGSEPPIELLEAELGMDIEPNERITTATTDAALPPLVDLSALPLPQQVAQSALGRALELVGEIDDLAVIEQAEALEKSGQNREDVIDAIAERWGALDQQARTEVRPATRKRCCAGCAKDVDYDLHGSGRSVHHLDGTEECIGSGRTWEEGKSPALFRDIDRDKAKLEAELKAEEQAFKARLTQSKPDTLATPTVPEAVTRILQATKQPDLAAAAVAVEDAYEEIRQLEDLVARHSDKLLSWERDYNTNNLALSQANVQLCDMVDRVRELTDVRDSIEQAAVACGWDKQGSVGRFITGLHRALEDAQAGAKATIQEWIEKELNPRNASIESLENLLAGLTGDLVEAKKVFKRLGEVMPSLLGHESDEDILAAAIYRIKRYEGYGGDFTSRLQEEWAEKEIAPRELRMQELQKQLAEANSRYGTAATQLASYTKLADELKAKNNALSSQLREESERVRGLDADVRSRGQDIARLREEIAALNAEITTVSRDNGRLVRERDGAKGQGVLAGPVSVETTDEDLLEMFGAALGRAQQLGALLRHRGYSVVIKTEIG